MQNTVQSVLKHERGQLHVVQAWRFSAKYFQRQTCLHQGACSYESVLGT